MVFIHPPLLRVGFLDGHATLWSASSYLLSFWILSTCSTSFRKGHSSFSLTEMEDLEGKFLICHLQASVFTNTDMNHPYFLIITQANFFIDLFRDYSIIFLHFMHYHFPCLPDISHQLPKILLTFQTSNLTKSSWSLFIPRGSSYPLSVPLHSIASWKNCLCLLFPFLLSSVKSSPNSLLSLPFNLDLWMTFTLWETMNNACCAVNFGQSFWLPLHFLCFMY